MSRTQLARVARLARVVVCLISVCALSAGCSSRRETSCRFGTEHAVYSSSALELDDISLVVRGSLRLALLSDVSGLYLRELSSKGLPLSAAVRLGERCAGGIDAVLDGAQLYIACLRPSLAAQDATVKEDVTLYTLDASHRITRTQRFGGAGSRSHGVSMAVLASRVLIAFQDAVVGEGRAWLAEVDKAGVGNAKLRLLSDASWVASVPSLARRGDDVLATWVEMGNGGDAALGRVMVAEVQRARAPSVLVQTQSLAPSPQLIALPDKWMLAFRDSRDAHRKTGLYLVALDSDAHVLGQAVRVSRADSQGRPMLRACDTGLVAATPRTFGGEDFVGAVGVDAELRNVSGEQQFYQDDREFSQVTGACDEGSALLLIGERGKPGRGNGSLRAVPFRCE